MELGANFIEAAAAELISAKSCFYNPHQIYNELLKFPHLKCQITTIGCSQKSNQGFNTFYIYNKNKPILPCIVYIHGLSSYCFEGLYLLQYIGENFNLCIYDLRGHGKNKNLQVTYGIKEATDLYDLINHLNQKQITEIFLWGRSMGASTILNFLNLYNNFYTIKQNVKFVVLDSPFCSFSRISKETLSNNLGLPAFICSPLINATFNIILQKYKLNLESLDFSNLVNVKCPSIFIYSQKDDIVNSSHSEQIIKGYGGKSYILKGLFSHNQPRPVQTIKQTFRLINIRRMNKVNPTISSKKGLSISLISCTNIQFDQKENIPVKNLNQKPMMATQHLRKRQNIQNQCISLTIKNNIIQNTSPGPCIQRVIQFRNKSKQKPKSRPPTLTNKRYI